MYTVIICSIIALLFTYLDSKALLKHGMKLGFILVTILGAIHYDYGNDYMSYYRMYKAYTCYTFNLSEVFANGKYNGVEPGWVLLSWIFKPIGGFFAMVAILNAIQNSIVYYFIRNNVEKSWWPVSLSIYLFNTSFYLLSFSMMRQEFVIYAFLGLWPFIRDRKYYIVFPVLYMLTFIHTSALILLPFAFWGFLPVKNGKFLSLLYAFVFLFLWFGQGAINDMLMMSMNNEDLANYIDGYGKGKNALTFGVGYIINLIPLFLGLCFLMKHKGQNNLNAKRVVALASVSFLMAPFSAVIQLIERVSIYFGVYAICSIPIAYGSVHNKVLRKSLVALYIFMLMFNYINFFRSDTWIEKYSTFHTIFSQI